MKEELIKYAELHTSGESDLLKELREHCYANYSDSNMLSGFYQGRVLSMVSKLLKPKLILEIGTYLGYSALCLAEGLAEDGKIITLDNNEETNAVARAFAKRSTFADKIEFRIADAMREITEIDEAIDLVFIDADKENYSNYYDRIFDKVRLGGVIIADNVLWSGKVLDKEKDTSTRALHNFNEKALADGRVSNVLLPIRDGLMVVRKESN